MARVCEICGKKPSVGNTVSHANNRSRRRWLPNLRRVHVIGEGGEPRHMRVCTRCLSAGKVRKA